MVIAAGKVSLSQAGPGALALRFPDYEKAGDSLTLTFHSGVKTLRQVAVASWLDEPKNQVTLEVNFQSMPDGTNYAAMTLLTERDAIPYLLETQGERAPHLGSP